jgi:xanthosine utilization system XapX-like protein
MTSPAPPAIPLPALIAVLLGVSLVTLDISLTSTALPTIARGIGADAAMATGPSTSPASASSRWDRSRAASPRP